MKLWAVDSVYWPRKLVNVVPKGWTMPSEAKKLKIGVLAETAFEMFVKVVEHSNGEKSYLGFCIEVFEKDVEVLGYDLPYKFERFHLLYGDLVLCIGNKVTTNSIFREKIYSNYTSGGCDVAFVVFVVTSSYMYQSHINAHSPRQSQQVMYIEFLRRTNAIVGDGDSYVKHYSVNVLQFKEHNIKALGSQYNYPESLRVAISRDFS
ncbi:Glutamate receptor 2.6 [Camellia lanceoleosa]|uniref:Glutamate receptor 2.6 n=1 Tax=Camellia lanceoleosa TaxID=1840588 RepID=A0ACC0HJ05_9ERIC|nr:Glutamate receptor 2.6 [Camellia lanceoleosa]